MTDTTLPATPSLAQTMWNKAQYAFLSHWDKLLNLTLGAIVTYFGMWIADLVNHQPPPPSAPKIVEVVKTVPDTGSTAQRVASIESELKALREEFSEFAARKGKRKAAIQPAK